MFFVAFSSSRLLLRALLCSGLGCGAGRRGRKEGTRLLYLVQPLCALPPWGHNSESPHGPGRITPGHLTNCKKPLSLEEQNLIRGCCATSLLGYRCDSIAQNDCTVPFASCVGFFFFPFDIICYSWLKCQCFCGCFNLPVQHRARGCATVTFNSLSTSSLVGGSSLENQNREVME